MFVVYFLIAQKVGKDMRTDKTRHIIITRRSRLLHSVSSSLSRISKIVLIQAERA